MARAFRRLIELLDARRRRRLRLCRRGAAPPPTTAAAAPQPSPTTAAAPPQPSEPLQLPTLDTVHERTSFIGSADNPDIIACLASSPIYMKYIKGGGTMNGKVRRTQKGQLVLERKIVELAVKNHQGTVLERLHAPKTDPLMKIVRVSTRMEVRIAAWLLNNHGWHFRVVVWGHVTHKEFLLLLREARNQGIILFHLGMPQD